MMSLHVGDSLANLGVGPLLHDFIFFVMPDPMGSSGLEPPTSRLSGARSNQLSYEPIGGDAAFLEESLAKNFMKVFYSFIPFP